jgi:hypothetical protein
MRFPRMTTRRWMIAVAAVAVLAWGFHRAGFFALAWEAPLLGSSLGILLAREKQRRLAGSVLGGAVTGACFWFVNFFFYQQYTYVTVFTMPNEPFTEAIGGAVGGALVGLLVAGVALRFRFTIRWLMETTAIVAIALWMLIVHSRMLGLVIILWMLYVWGLYPFRRLYGFARLRRIFAGWIRGHQPVNVEDRAEDEHRVWQG